MNMASIFTASITTLVCIVLIVVLRRYSYSISYNHCRSDRPKVHQGVTVNLFRSIVPLSSEVDWKATAPLQLRPFKPQYHLTMSITNSTISELVLIDKTYHDRIRLRRQLLEAERDAVLACNKDAASAVLELHQWMFSIYLPQRFPTMFKISQPDCHDSKDMSGVMQNLTTEEDILIHEPDPIKALHNLGAHIDNDFLLLLPSSTDRNGSPIYHLEAFVTCFPNGFSTRAKLGLPLAAIHQPVPGYAQKLERSMDRYFAKLTVGIVVERANWSVITHDRLFSESGNHLYRHDEAQDNGNASDRQAHEEHMRMLQRDVVLEDCVLRVERQTLHRLPETKAIVFGIRTYTYTLDEVKACGDGPALAEAIEGLSKGNVPDMMYYKRCVVWGDKVKEYLRS